MSSPKRRRTARQNLALTLAFSGSVILITLLLGFILSDENLLSNNAIKNAPPSLSHPFGTDWLGRDMLTRTLKSLRLSLFVGFLASAAGGAIAALAGIAAATLGKKADAVISWFVDLFLGMPHLVFIILISFAAGGGIRGVICGVALTHWPALSRVIRAEVLAVKDSEYIQISRNTGKSRWYVATRHILPHIAPQIAVGVLLLFPRAIIHEATITFLGFGLSVQTPSLGLILSEAVKHIVLGHWWLALFPGFMLVSTVKSFDSIGEQLRILADPASANE